MNGYDAEELVVGGVRGQARDPPAHEPAERPRVVEPHARRGVPQRRPAPAARGAAVVRCARRAGPTRRRAAPRPCARRYAARRGYGPASAHGAHPAQARGVLVLPVPLARLRPLGQPAVLDARDAREGAGRRAAGRPGLETLDAGAGTGFTTEGIVERVDPERVTMLDQSPHQLARARAQAGARARAASCSATRSGCRSRTRRSTATCPRGASSTGPTRSAASPRPTACCARAASAS